MTQKELDEFRSHLSVDELEMFLPTYNYNAYYITRYEDEKLVGYLRAMDDGELFRINEVVVLPEHRGKGIGTYLVELYKEYCLKHKGFDRIELSSKREDRVENFHSKNGFRDIFNIAMALRREDNRK